MWFGRGSDVVRTWFGRGSDVGRRWLGRVFGSGTDTLAEAKGKWFPAVHPLIRPCVARWLLTDIPAPLQKKYFRKNNLKYYFWGHCNGSAWAVTQKILANSFLRSCILFASFSMEESVVSAATNYTRILGEFVSW